ncbi:MAG: hypothetical protein K0R54_738 [Clostridiaceae bacterium]|jgi:hypothetical protein|nr:hypothetical protein [Clostridiaceae bacterium]
MEKVIWVRSEEVSSSRVNDGLNEVNKYLEEGWKVKHIVAFNVVKSDSRTQAYIVIEKD